MDQKQYLQERVDDQIEWYSRKSGWNQKRYKTIRLTAASLAILIPFASGFLGSAPGIWLKVGIGAAGVIIAISEFLLSMNKYKELWIKYRTTSEALNREKLLFLTKSAGYGRSKTPFNDFVWAVERITAEENVKWVENISKEEEQAENTA